MLTSKAQEKEGKLKGLVKVGLVKRKAGNSDWKLKLLAGGGGLAALLVLLVQLLAVIVLLLRGAWVAEVFEADVALEVFEATEAARALEGRAGVGLAVLGAASGGDGQRNVLAVLLAGVLLEVGFVPEGG